MTVLLAGLFFFVFVAWYSWLMEHLSQEGDDKSLPENAVTKVQAPKPNRFFEKEYVDSLREDVLKDIFAAIAKKAGVNTTMEKFIPFKDILAVYNPKIQEVGMYYPEEHKIEINKYNAVSEEKAVTKSVTLAVLIHEELHAVTNTNSIKNSIEIGDTRQMGFQVETLDAITRKSIEKVWKDFNEGITELITDDILDEYIRRTGDRKEFHLEGFERGYPGSTHQSYLAERSMVNVVINRVSTDSGVSKDMVREAFVQAYFAGTPLEEIKKNLIEISGEELVSKIDSGVLVAPKDSVVKSTDNQEEEDEKNRAILIRLCTNFMKRSLV